MSVLQKWSCLPDVNCSYMSKYIKVTICVQTTADPRRRAAVVVCSSIIQSTTVQYGTATSILYKRYLYHADYTAVPPAPTHVSNKQQPKPEQFLA